MVATAPLARSLSRRLVVDAMDQTLVPLTTAAGTVNADGYDVPASDTEGAAFLASVFPETGRERIEADRPAGVTGYTIRAEQSAAVSALSHGDRVRWQRAASRGGNLVLEITGTRENRGEGRFVVLTATHTA